MWLCSRACVVYVCARRSFLKAAAYLRVVTRVGHTGVAQELAEHIRQWTKVLWQRLALRRNVTFSGSLLSIGLEGGKNGAG